MTSGRRKYKIALMGFRLGTGGAEKAQANLSVFFESKGIEVHNIIVLDDVSYKYSGKLLNLGKMKDRSNGVLNKLQRMLFLKKYLRENQFDFIIDFRPRTKILQELLVSKWLYGTNTIFSVRSYLLEYYMPGWKSLTRFMYGNCYSIVAVTDTTQKLIEDKFSLKNVVTVYNPIDFDELTERSNEDISVGFDYILGVGQMETTIKQFDKLIEAYSNSVLPAHNIHLILLGDGKERSSLEAMAAEKNLKGYVHFFGYQQNPYKFMRRSKYLVLSSLNEGMPNVILETLACGTPVVAFDCPTGPAELIKDRINGLLVEDQNVQKLTEAMDLFVNDRPLYDRCKHNARESVQAHSLENIGKQWLQLMKIEEA